MRQPQLELRPFDRERLKDVALRLRDLFVTDDPNRLRSKVTPEAISELVDDVTKGFKGDVGVVPRQFLRRFVNKMDLVVENQGASQPPPAMTVEEERAADGKKPIDYEPEADDDKGYPVSSVDF